MKVKEGDNKSFQDCNFPKDINPNSLTPAKAIRELVQLNYKIFSEAKVFKIKLTKEHLLEY